MTEVIKTRITSEAEGNEAIMKASKANPSKIITAYGRWGKLDIFINDRQPRTDSLDTIQTYNLNGGFIKNGKVINPTKTWMDKHNKIPMRTGG